MPIPLGWESWTIAGFILLVITVLSIVIWRKSKRVKPQSSEELNLQAYKTTIANLALCPSEDPTETATECSIILRRYLIKVTGDPALFETHEEWVARRDSIESLGSSIQQSVEDLCSKLAESKYTPADAKTEPGVMIEDTRQLIEAVHGEVMP